MLIVVCFENSQRSAAGVPATRTVGFDWIHKGRLFVNCGGDPSGCTRGSKFLPINKWNPTRESSGGKFRAEIRKRVVSVYEISIGGTSWTSTHS